MAGFSILSVVQTALGRAAKPRPLWHRANLASSYDVVVIGGGGHGLATAYHLAKDHRIARVAVLEHASIGAGNAALNAGIIRPAALWDETTRLYQDAIGRWQTLGQELACHDLHPERLFAPRGLLTLAHTDGDERALRRRVYANQRQGVEAVWLSRDEIATLCPQLALDGPRWPILGACWHPHGGAADHNALTWGYAHHASRLGVDLIERCSVQAICSHGGAVTGLETSRGVIHTNNVILAAAGGALALAKTAGVALPLEQKPLHAFVTEPVQPTLSPIVVSPAAGVCVIQGQDGALMVTGDVGAAGESWWSLERQAAGVVGLMPSLARVRAARCWSGMVDLSPDASPVVGRTPLDGLWITGGWGANGFHVIPAVGALLAEQVATGRCSDILAPFDMARFASGALIDERTAALISASFDPKGAGLYGEQPSFAETTEDRP